MRWRSKSSVAYHLLQSAIMHWYLEHKMEPMSLPKPQTGSKPISTSTTTQIRDGSHQTHPRDHDATELRWLPADKMVVIVPEIIGKYTVWSFRETRFVPNIWSSWIDTTSIFEGRSTTIKAHRSTVSMDGRPLVARQNDNTTPRIIKRENVERTASHVLRRIRKRIWLRDILQNQDVQ